RRSSDLAGDRATVDAAAREATLQTDRREYAHVLHLPRTTHGQDALPHARSPIVILYANVPVRPAGLIDRAAARLIETGCDSVQSYAPVGKYHPWWMARIDPVNGDVRPWEGDVLNHNIFRRQDLPPCYVPDGGVIAVTRRALFREIPGVPD